MEKKIVWGSKSIRVLIDKDIETKINSYRNRSKGVVTPKPVQTLELDFTTPRYIREF